MPVSFNTDLGGLVLWLSFDTVLMQDDRRGSPIVLCHGLFFLPQLHVADGNLSMDD